MLYLPMGKYFIIFIFIFMSVSKANALSALLRQELKKLDPQTRMEQRCDIAAMEAIAASHQYAPDKAIAYSFAEPIIKGDTLEAPGATFRSHNNWYHLSFVCTTSNDKLDVKTFNYQIGHMVPRSEWQHYYLVP